MAVRTGEPGLQDSVGDIESILGRRLNKLNGFGLRTSRADENKRSAFKLTHRVCAFAIPSKRLDDFAGRV